MRHRPIKILLVISFLLLGLSAFLTQAQAQSSQETLNQYIADLQKNPDDQALREKIIKFALTLNPKPAVPKDVVVHEGAAEYAFKNAKTVADFMDAAKEYDQALLLAPWLAQDYYNCGVAYEKAEKFDAAVQNFNFYLMAAPDAKDSNDVFKRIGGLEYAGRKAAQETSPEAVAAKKQDESEVWLKNLDGARFIGPPIPNGAIGYERDTMYLVYYIEGNKVHGGWFDREPADYKTAPIRGVEFIDGSRSVWSLDIQGKQFSIPQPSFQDFRYDTATISDDGQFITFVHNKFVMKRVK